MFFGVCGGRFHGGSALSGAAVAPEREGLVQGNVRSDRTPQPAQEFKIPETNSAWGGEVLDKFRFETRTTEDGPTPAAG